MKRIIGLSLVLAFASTGFSEPMRTVLTKENKFPEQNQLEVGVIGRYVEMPYVEHTTLAPYIRYGALNNFSVYGKLPYERIEDEFWGSESGVGDISVGLELRTYEDLFGYPWVIPHFEMQLATGSEKRGTGEGEEMYTIGIAAGTTTYDRYHWAADARYRIRNNRDNIPSIAGSIVWDVDKNFSFIAEIELSRDKERDRHPLTFLGGMYYKATKALHFGLHGGTTKNSDEDVIIQGRMAYTF